MVGEPGREGDRPAPLYKCDNGCGADAGRSFAATAANSIYALDAATGTQLWRTNFGPSSGNGVVPGGLPGATGIYPRNGQNTSQTAADQQQCNQWANSQLGGGGTAEMFQRNFAACMDMRGYSLR